MIARSQMDTPLIWTSSYAQPGDEGVRVWTLDAAANTLMPRGGFRGIANPTFLAVHPHGPWVYVAGETHSNDNTPGTVWALRYDPDTFAVEEINHQPSDGDDACHVILDRAGKWVIVSNYSSGSVTVFPVQADGALGAASDHHQHQGTSADPERQEGPHAHCAIFSPDERYVIVADLGIDQLVVYTFDAERGTLTPHGHADAPAGAGPRHLVFHPNGTLLYAANELDSTVAVYEYDATNGTLRLRDVQTTLPPDSPESYVADIHLTASGDYLLVSNRGHNSLAVFGVEDDGGLTLLDTPSCGGDWPRNFAIAPEDHMVLVANQNSGLISILPLDGATVGSARAQIAVPGASCVIWTTNDHRPTTND
jgi:6-phosphogluconolactonase